MYRFASSLIASAVLVFLGTATLGAAIAPAAPKTIFTAVAHAHPKPNWVATSLHGL